ncbi:MAG: type II toxin-antitoxin system VapC family toxin [Dehalococcoidia bacterium]
MTLVIDANIPIVLANPDPRREVVRSLVREWIDSREPLHAPALLPYEVASGLTRIVAAGRMSADDLNRSWSVLLSLPITYHSLDLHGDKVIQIALRLGRQSAYDAAYLALTQDLHAQFWTLDGPLARNAANLGFPVHLIQ